MPELKTPKEKKQPKDAEDRPFRCKGSFTRGTACGTCVRCQERGYDEQAKKDAVEKEQERVKDLPSDRVKPKNPTPVIVVENVIATPEEPKPEDPVEPVEPADPVTPRKEKI